MSLNGDITIDFIGIGAEKAGSTWIADVLRLHPDIYLPNKKEIYFFNEYDPHFLKVMNPKYEWGIDWYLDHFRDVKKTALKGEFSPTYLYSEKTARRIYAHFPDVKLLVVLRDPVERAFSQYVQDKRFGLLDGLEFMEAFETNDSFLEKSLYHKYLSCYFEVFGKNSIKVVLLEDIKDDPKKVMKDIYEFLGTKNINHDPGLLDEKRNVAKKARFVRLNKYLISTEYALRRSGFNWFLRYLEGSGIRETAIKLRDFNAVKYDVPPKLSKKNKIKIAKYFKDDVNNLEKLIKRKLPTWLNY